MADGPAGLAATVVVLRDRPDGAEVLLLERPGRGSFAGAWVFPGGAVDPGDAVADAAPAIAEEAAARRAAVRETAEETGLAVDADALVTLARWHPPAEAPKRLVTWFFVIEAEEAPVALNPEEAVSAAWLRPADALGRHAAGRMLLYPPTWMTLNALDSPATASAAVEAARLAGAAEFVSRFSGDGGTLFWEGDVAHRDDALIDAPGGRNRLRVADLPWRYERADADG